MGSAAAAAIAAVIANHRQTMSVDYLFEEFATTIFAAATTSVGGLIAAWVWERFQRQKKEAQAEINHIAEAAKNVSEKASAAAGPQRVRTVDAIISQRDSGLVSSVESLITGYHEQALSQARVQFWFSVVAATVGFVWILYAGYDIRPDNIATTLKTFPGIVMDAVAFLFFRQASETRQRATDLYDRLRTDRQSAASVALVSSIEDSHVRSAVKAQIALHMAGLEPSPIDLGHFLSSQPRSVIGQPLAAHAQSSG